MMNRFGRGFTFVIKTSYDIHDEWMCLSLWYSINKYLPEAKVVLLCRWKNGIVDRTLYDWTFKTSVVCFKYEDNDKNPLSIIIDNGLEGEKTIILNCGYFCFKEFPVEFVNFAETNRIAGNEDCLFLNKITSKNISYFQTTNYKTDIPLIYSSFQRYTDIKFLDIQKWISEKKTPPFEIAWKFASNGLSVREYNLLDIWEKIGILKNSLFKADIT